MTEALQRDAAIWFLDGLARPCGDRGDIGGPGYTERAKERIRQTSPRTLAVADALRQAHRQCGKPLKPCQACQMAVIALGAAEDFDTKGEALK